MRVERIKIIKGDPEQVYQMLMTGTVDYDKGFDDLRNAVRKNNESMQPRMNSGPTVIFPGVAGASSYPTVVQGNNVLPMDSSRAATESAADIFLPTESANQRQPGGGGNGAGQPGGNNQNNGGGAAPQGGVGFVPEGIRKVSYDPATNSLIVEGDDDAIKQLRNLVNLFDQVPKQVIVKVEFITTSQSVTKALGMDWLYQRGAINAGNRPGSFAEVSNPIFINYATGNITTRLRTILSEGGGKTVNAPLVRTLNNQAASVNQQLQTWYFTTQATNGPGGIIINTIPQPITIPTNLSIRPRINDDGYITMNLQPTISDLGQIRRDQNGNSFPDISQQSVTVVARVKSGETIALGGLTRKQTRTTVQKFPVLADLPLVGSLFRSTNTERNDSELLIFVTPIIVEDQDQGGLGP
jgi:general secretion pathway protein D